MCEEISVNDDLPIHVREEKLRKEELEFQAMEVRARDPSPDRLSTFEVTPDLVVYTEQVTDDGTPEVVLERLRDMRRKEEIERMWHAEHTRTYIPFTEEARKMKLASKLRNRTETRHATIVQKGLQAVQKPLELDFERMKLIKPSNEQPDHGKTVDIWTVAKKQ